MLFALGLSGLVANLKVLDFLNSVLVILCLVNFWCCWISRGKTRVLKTRKGPNHRTFTNKWVWERPQNKKIARVSPCFIVVFLYLYWFVYGFIRRNPPKM